VANVAKQARIIAGQDGAKALLYRQVLLYLATSLTLVMLVLGILTSIWLWQVKTWGVRLNTAGVVLQVTRDSAAAALSLLPGDTIDFEDGQKLRRLAAQVPSGYALTVTAWHNARSRTVTLEARSPSIMESLDQSVETWVGMGFVLLGFAPLVARRRGFTLWLFYLASELTGLFLISDTPRLFRLNWAEVATALSLPLLPPVLFHFHTLFPEQRLGKWRLFAVALAYSCGLLVLPHSISALWDYSVYASDTWRLLISGYIAVALLACVLLLVRGFVSTRNEEVRAQLKLITFGSGFGLLFNGLIATLPASQFNQETNTVLDSIGLLSALGTPLAYCYSMMRHDVLIGGMLWRQWLFRIVWSVLLMLIWLAFVIGMLGPGLWTPGTGFVLWAAVVLSALATLIIQEKLWQWLEGRVFGGKEHEELLASVRERLVSFRSLEEYVEFFIDDLPRLLKLTGSIVFLSTGSAAPLILRGRSLSLSTAPTPGRVPSLGDNNQLSAKLASERGPIPLSTLRKPGVAPYNAADQQFVEFLRSAQIELLLPIRSTRRLHLIGLVALGSKATDEAYSPQDLTLLAALAHAASTSAENVLLLEALHDQLAELKKERDDRISLARYALSAQVEERKRIAREVHNDTLQDLAVTVRALTGILDDVEDILAMSEQLSISMANDDVVAEIGAVHTQLTPVLQEVQLRLAILRGEDTALIERFEKQPTESNSFENRRSLEAIIDHVRCTEERLREICNNLHPVYWDDLLVKTLKASISRFQRQNPGISIHFKVGGTEPGGLAADTKAAMKEVMEQAVHNAIKHAQPAHIDAVVTFETNGRVTLCVSDDGIGFSPRPFTELRAAGHHGLANMKEHTVLVDGEMSIYSSPGGGTRVTLIINSGMLPSGLPSILPIDNLNQHD
jgi:signal transduction histidine kinase